MNSLHTPALTGVFFILSLFSNLIVADEAVGPYGYPLHAKSTDTTITVNVIWKQNVKDVDSICNELGGKKPTGTIIGCYDYNTKTIYAVEPTSFNDEPRLFILGHEFWHALGAEHP